MHIDIRRTPFPTSEEQVERSLLRSEVDITFTDHILISEWTPNDGWGNARVEAYSPLSLGTSTRPPLEGEELFETVVAYRHSDGTVWSFRPAAHAKRLAHLSAEIGLPTLPVEDFVALVEALVATDRAWVPDSTQTGCLCLRTLLIPSRNFWAPETSARRLTFMIIAWPVGPRPGLEPGVIPASAVWRSGDMAPDSDRDSDLFASRAGETTGRIGRPNITVTLGGPDNQWVSGVEGQELFLVRQDHTVLSPTDEETGKASVILDSLLELLRREGWTVVERQVSLDEWVDGATTGDITEAFVCDSTAVLRSLGTLDWPGGTVAMSDRPGPVATSVGQALAAIQTGTTSDTFGWLHRMHEVRDR